MFGHSDEYSQLVSVIIPTYNRSDLLKDAVMSVFKQTHRPIQCIIVDDGSNDDTAIVVDELNLLNNASFEIKYIFQHNSGSQVARNKGTDAASGEFIQYLDSDDLLYPHKLEKQLAYIKNHPECDAVFGDWESGTTQAKVLIKGYISHDFISQMLTLERSIANFSILMRRQLVKKIGSWDISLRRCQEIDYHLRGIMEGGIYHYFPINTGLWRYHENERIHNQSGVDAIGQFYIKWEEVLSKKGLFTTSMAEKIADWYMWFLALSKPKDTEVILSVLEDAIRLKPSISFYNSFKMRLLRLLFGRRLALKIWITYFF